MSTIVKDAVKGIKDAEREISAWEGRLAHVKSEVENLQRVREQSQKDIEAIRSAAQQEISQKMVKARQDQARADEALRKLVDDKAEFASIIQAVQREKDSLGDIRADLENAKKEYFAKTDKAKLFITLVKREAEGL